ncbi:efflux RND transporter periplasmic adaptor subunit [Cohnella pontilimi]|uniref:Efflux RND transporter periplasmic adaptor subunit n=1 Tax=Cohnella pontilimi TaxID=2564100 RepID=A0A4U0FEG6_9BACL|nr:efflux RND transporter periplasmic adaptor subunit [Cohnella pontilimi]TJY43336.1 efflux RND transporter periplasmic adaptor subunit [Cohnella pontilimi]
MCTKWWTAYSSQTDKPEGKRREGVRTKGVLAAVALSLALSGCSLLPNEPAEEDLSAIQLPQISKKPEYEVTTKTLETKVSGSGKILSLQEKTLYFTLDGKRLKKIYIHAGDKVKAGQPIAELDVEDMQKMLRSEQLSMKKQELQIKDLLRKKDEMDPIDFETQMLGFEEQRQKLSDMQADIAKATLTAPFSGTVVSVSVQEGAQIKAYDPICVLADPSRLAVGASLSKEDLEKVTPGMEVEVSINGLDPLKGKVKQLPLPEADNGNGNGGGVPGGNPGPRVEQYMMVEVPNLPKTVERGTNLTASVILSRKNNAVVIPLAALRSISGRTYVQVIEADGSKREVDVEVGQQTPTEAEILQGLTPGQKVVGR